MAHLKKLSLYLIFLLLSLDVFARVDQEEAYLSLDKSFYLQGETAWFSLFSFRGDTKQLLRGSQYMQLTLVNHEGKVKFQHHLKVLNGRASGQLEFSRQLEAGNYLLVLGYSSESVENYVYRKLVRLYSSNIEDYNSNLSSIEKTGKPDSRLNETTTVNSPNLSLSTNGNSFKKRAQVTLNLESRAVAYKDLSLSLVVRKRSVGLWSKSGIQDVSNSLDQKTLDGQVGFANKRKNRPVNFEQTDQHRSLLFKLDKVEGPEETSVNSAFMVDEQEELLVFKNEEGQFILDASNLSSGIKTFYFNHFYFLPYSDNRYRYVRKRWMNGGELKLKWAEDKRDFSKILPDGINSPLEVTDAVREYVLQTDLRNKISKAYGLDEPERSTMVVEDYQPSDWYNVADYAQMADFPEFLKEVVSGLKYTNKEGVKDFRFSYPGDKYRGMPFILVDGVPTVDANKVLNIPLSNIEGVGVLKDLTTDTKMARQNRADLVKFGYFGKNGILFIKLKNNVGNPFLNEYRSLPSRELIMKTRKPDFPSYTNGTTASKPDFRPVLHWDPELKFVDGKISISFYTSDDTGEYDIILEGIAANGDIVNVQKTITVSNTSAN